MYIFIYMDVQAVPEGRLLFEHFEHGVRTPQHVFHDAVVAAQQHGFGTCDVCVTKDIFWVFEQEDPGVRATCSGSSNI